jgi:hypothetical protein
MLFPPQPMLCSAFLQPCKLISGDLGGIATEVIAIGWRRSRVDHLTGVSPNWSSHFGLLASILIILMSMD